MSRIRNVLTSTAILVGSSAALLTGGIAKADPVPIPPPIPGLAAIQDLFNPAKAPQLLQAASSVLTGAPAAPVAPVTPPPLASASVNLPQQPAAIPATAALPGLAPATGPTLTPPATATLPGITPVSAPLVTPPATTLAGFIPSGEINLPSVPGLPIPLPQRLSFPGDLSALMPGIAGSAITQPGVAPSASATSPMPSVAALFPTSALP